MNTYVDLQDAIHKTENGAHEKTTSKNEIKKAKADCGAKKGGAYLSVQQTFCTQIKPPYGA